MIKKIMILLSVMLLLVGCQTNEVPPSPDSPGGVAGEYSVAVDELGNWANEAVGFELSNDMIQVIPVRSAYAQGKILESEAWAWKTVYIYNFNSETWYEEEIDAEIYKNTNWINVQNPIRNGNNIDTLTFYPGLNSLESKYDGENIIAIYSCAKESNSFDCHGGWQVEGFDVNYYFVQDVNVSVDITGTQESSIIELSLPEKLPENIEISINPIVNNFETVTSERVEKTNEGYVISADWSDDQRTFVLPVVWDYEGEYDLEVSVYGIQSNKPGQTVNAFGDISLSLPDMPGAIGGLEQGCCLKTINGDFCQDVKASECDIDAPGSQACYAVLECSTLGCCIDNYDGSIMRNVQGNTEMSPQECSSFGIDFSFMEGSYMEGASGGVCTPIGISDITIFVIDGKDDSPITGATVTTNTGKEDVTDINGRVEFNSHPSGYFTYEVVANNYQLISGINNIYEGVLNSFNVRLEPIDQTCDVDADCSEGYCGYDGVCVDESNFLKVETIVSNLDRDGQNLKKIESLSDDYIVWEEYTSGSYYDVTLYGFDLANEEIINVDDEFINLERDSDSNPEIDHDAGILLKNDDTFLKKDVDGTFIINYETGDREKLNNFDIQYLDGLDRAISLEDSILYTHYIGGGDVKMYKYYLNNESLELLEIINGDVIARTNDLIVIRTSSDGKFEFSFYSAAAEKVTLQYKLAYEDVTNFDVRNDRVYWAEKKQNDLWDIKVATIR